MMIEDGEYGEFKGTTQQAIREILDDVKHIRERVDSLCVDHETRLVTLENGVRFSKWVFGAILAILTYLGVKP